MSKKEVSIRLPSRLGEDLYENPSEFLGETGPAVTAAATKIHQEKTF